MHQETKKTIHDKVEYNGETFDAYETVAYHQMDIINKKVVIQKRHGGKDISLEDVIISPSEKRKIKYRSMLARKQKKEPRYK